MATFDPHAAARSPAPPGAPAASAAPGAPGAPGAPAAPGASAASAAPGASAAPAAPGDPADPTDRLGAELRQTRPFPSLAVSGFLAIQRTADDLTAAFVHLLRPFGLTPSQYNVLRILRGSGERGLPTLEIGQRMVRREPDMPRLVARLEKAGWIERERCTRDRRVVYARLTEQGRELLARLDEPVNSLHARQMHVLSDTEQRTLIELLDRLRHPR
jgi:DNA-binding MarR family transcriptional regulator